MSHMTETENELRRLLGEDRSHEVTFSEFDGAHSENHATP